MNILKINYNLDNFENILKQSVNSNTVFLYFEKKYDDKSKFKKPTKENILRLKDKLESIERIMQIEIKDFCVYKELLFLCENLKMNLLYFKSCCFEKGTEDKIVKLLNNCSSLINIYYKIDKILFYAIKNYFIKGKDKNLYLYRVDYESMKNIFFGMYLHILKLINLETNEREMRKILKSLHGTINLRNFTYDNNKAYGLIYNRKNMMTSTNKKQKGYIYNIRKKFKFKVGKANEIFLNLLPNWINVVEIKSNYKEEDFKYLLTKFYKGGILILNKSEYLNIKYFGDLNKQSDIDLLEYVTNLK